jgi:hypothetical protein
VSAKRHLLAQLERLSRMDAADRNAQAIAADSSDLGESLRLLERLEGIHVPEPSLDAMWQGRKVLLANVQQQGQPFTIMPSGIFSGRLAHALPGAVLAAVLVATTAGGAAVAGVDAPRATVNEVLSALGLNDQAERPVAPSPMSPLASPLPSQDNSAWPPVEIETGAHAGLPGPDETSGSSGPQTPATSGQKPGQSADNPGHGGENPGLGVGPDGDGTPPGHGENPGQGREDQVNATPPASEGKDNAGQGNGNGNGQGNKP